jgi:energy-coupling factor transporter ATP-binding protein EcfA2
MKHYSILSGSAQDGGSRDALVAPPFFADLNLDQIVDAITAGRQEYNLKPFFYAPLQDVAMIEYRHEVMRDLENEVTFNTITSFADDLRLMRQQLAFIDKLTYKHHKQGWFLEAVAIYCKAVTGLVRGLIPEHCGSRGLLAFREYIMRYADSSEFTALFAETKKLQGDLSATNYCLLIKDGSVTVRKYDSEVDYSAVVEKTFGKFKQEAAKDYMVKYATRRGMNHVEAAILDFVARLYPDMFSRLDDYCARNGNYLDGTVAMFDREIQFYIAYLEYVAVLKRAGLRLCYPVLSSQSKDVYSREGFDMALAHKLIAAHASVVCNDFHMKDKERIVVVTGPNQGGKTTFARTFGQLHYLASLGCPVPGAEARLFLFDRLFTHFEHEEDITTLRGKLHDDLSRIHRIIAQATPDSIIIINEMFSSTTVKDGVYLSNKVMELISRLDSLCVCVTFLDELASFNENTVSVVAQVAADNPTLRTFKIERMPADGLAYAHAIAEKHRLTYPRLMERIGP